MSLNKQLSHKSDVRDARSVELHIRADHFPVQPFLQTPSDDRQDGLNTGLCAHDLFSLFTAEIILENKVFVR